jgi:hypothetical protein
MMALAKKALPPRPPRPLKNIIFYRKIVGVSFKHFLEKLYCVEKVTKLPFDGIKYKRKNS